MREPNNPLDTVDSSIVNGVQQPNPVLNNVEWEIVYGPKNYSLAEKQLSQILHTYLYHPASIGMFTLFGERESDIILEIKHKKTFFNLTKLLQSGPDLSHIPFDALDLDTYIQVLTGVKKDNMTAIRGMFHSDVVLPLDLTTQIDQEFPSWHIAHKVAVFIWSLSTFKAFDGDMPFNLNLKRKYHASPFEEIQSLLRTGLLSSPHLKSETHRPDMILCLLLTACILSHAYHLGLSDRFLSRKQGEETLKQQEVFRFESAYGENYLQIRKDSNQSKQPLRVAGFVSFSKTLFFENCHRFADVNKPIYIFQTSEQQGISIFRFTQKELEKEVLYDNNIHFLIKKIIGNNESNLTTEENLDLTLFEVEPVWSLAECDATNIAYRLFHKKFIETFSMSISEQKEKISYNPVQIAQNSQSLNKLYKINTQKHFFFKPAVNPSLRDSHKTVMAIGMSLYSSIKNKQVFVENVQGYTEERTANFHF